VYVEGRLRTNKWQDKETGQDRYSTEVIASEMIFLSQPRDLESDIQQEEDAEIAAPEAYSALHIFLK
jgi:single-strand DNA-binding protein